MESTKNMIILLAIIALKTHSLPIFSRLFASKTVQDNFTFYDTAFDENGTVLYCAGTRLGVGTILKYSISGPTPILLGSFNNSQLADTIYYKI